MNCNYCEDTGYWIDTANEQTKRCPFCTKLPTPSVGLPEWDSYWPKLECKHKGPSFRTLPWLLVIHSGGKTANVAEFFNKKGSIERKGKSPLVVSAHINWSKDFEGFTQGVELNRVAWHCGGSSYNGLKNLNFCSIGIELPGPANRKMRPRKELAAFEETLSILLDLVPSLKVAVRHSDIDLKKVDPGPGFDWDLINSFGLYLPCKK